jgi:hypothetical protein
MISLLARGVSRPTLPRVARVSLQESNVMVARVCALLGFITTQTAMAHTRDGMPSGSRRGQAATV